MQLRTGIIGLNQYFWRINKRESPLCQCELSEQTPRHILMECPLYIDEREAMWKRIQGGA